MSFELEFPTSVSYQGHPPPENFKIEVFEMGLQHQCLENVLSQPHNLPEWFWGLSSQKVHRGQFEITSTITP